MNIAGILRERGPSLENMTYTNFQIVEWGRWKRMPAEKRPFHPNAERIERIMAELPIEVSELVELKYIRRLPLAAIASSMDMSRQTLAGKLDTATAFVLAKLEDG